ncbi:MAG: flavin reductase [Burkholderiaceae bacterium]|nr:flavin reductase [Burkholderiaceae bacterium]
MKNYLQPVSLDHAYLLFNLGATSLVSASHQADEDVMPATWVCPLDLKPSKVTAVIDRTHYTRGLIEKSGYFALMLPGKGIIDQVMYLGTTSKNDEINKLEKSGSEFFYFPGFDIPMVCGCAAYAIFKVIPEEHNEKTYDLFIGECVGAWSDCRVCRNGHWSFDQENDSLRLLHYSAGGHFYTLGDSISPKKI